MFKCYEGHLFDEPKIVKEPHGEYLSHCPVCGEDFEEAEQCLFCGEYFRTNDLYDGVCEDCIHDYRYDWQTCVRFADKDKVKQEIEINGVLAYLFNTYEIEQILVEHLQKTTKSCTGSDVEKERIKQRTDCSEFIDEDPYWFAGMILKDDAERRKNLYVR